jgi:hypothetical protein
MDGIHNRVGGPIICVRVGCAEFDPLEYRHRIEWNIEANCLALDLGRSKGRLGEGYAWPRGLTDGWGRPGDYLWVVAHDERLVSDSAERNIEILIFDLESKSFLRQGSGSVRR